MCLIVVEGQIIWISNEGIFQFECYFLDSKKTAQAEHVQEHRDQGAVNICVIQQRENENAHKAKKGCQLSVRERKIRKRRSAAIVVLLGPIGNVLIDSGHDGRSHATRASVEVFSGNEFSQPEGAQRVLGGMPADLAQHLDLGVADSSQHRKWAGGVVDGSFARILGRSEQEHDDAGEFVDALYSNAGISLGFVGFVDPIIFLDFLFSHQNFDLHFFGIYGGKFLGRHFDFVRTRNIENKNRAVRKRTAC